MLAETQSQVWDFVNYQIEISKIRRVNWKALLGVTLTEYITNLQAQYGLNAEQTFQHISVVLQRNNLDSNDNLRRLKISVYSRFAEQSSYKKRIGGE